MKVLILIYLVFMFISTYLLFLFGLLYLRNKKNLYEHPAKTKKTLDVIVPAYNEEKCIEGTLKAILASDYPIEKIIVVNDGSTDRTREIVEKLAKESNKILLINKPNSGKANSLNWGLDKVDAELVAVVDADSYPEPDAISKMVGYFDDAKTGAVTSAILVKNKDGFIQGLQVMEYAIIAWTRKLLDFIGGVWATPGPLSIYKKEALDRVGGFDARNITEDIEITWRLVHEGYKVRMCLAAKTYTNVPTKIKHWWRQRIRWDIGGIQTIWKYKKCFFRKGMLGNFILPFFVMSMFIGLLGIMVFAVLALQRLLGTFLFAKYTFIAKTPIFTDITFTPSVLNFLGLTLFVLGFMFTLTGLFCLQEGQFLKRNLLTLIVYGTFYLMVYPLILVVAIYKMLVGDIKW